jgi:hypothetical protein
MSESRNPPNRRRRRIVVLSALFLVTVCTAWWCWPHGDARFVGKWDIRLGTNPGESVGLFELRANGTGWHPLMGIPFWIPSWKFRQDELVIGNNATGKTTRFHKLIERPLVRWTGIEIDDTERVFQVLAVSDQRLDLRMKADGRDFIFLRLPE